MKKEIMMPADFEYSEWEIKILKLIEEVLKSIPEEEAKSIEDKLAEDYGVVFTSDENESIASAGLGDDYVNGAQIRLKSNDIKNKSDKEIKEILAHELAHVLLHTEEPVERRHVERTFQKFLNQLEAIVKQIEWGYFFEFTQGFLKNVVEGYSELLSWISDMGKPEPGEILGFWRINSTHLPHLKALSDWLNTAIPKVESDEELEITIENIQDKNGLYFRVARHRVYGEEESWSKEGEDFHLETLT